MKSIGLKAGARLLSYELLRADDIPTIAKKLELSGNDFIHYFVRLRTGNDKPIPHYPSKIAITLAFK